MPGSEFYRLDIVINTTGDEQAKGKLQALDKFLEHTRKRGEMLNRMQVSPAVRLIDRVSGPLRTIERNLGRLKTVKKITIEAVDNVSDVAKRIGRTLTSPLVMLGAGAGATAAIAFPLKLAGEMDRARRSIELYSGSVEVGRKNFEELVNLAVKSPLYEVPFVVKQAGQLLATGQDINFVKRALNAFGNAAMYTGASLEQLELAFYGFRQIASVGTLSMEELRQVTQNLNLSIAWVAEELGVSGDELRELGKQGIPAKRAMEAIIRTLEKRFPVKDFNDDLLALVSNVKEGVRTVVWNFGEGMAKPVIRIFQDLTGALDPTSEKFKDFRQRVEDTGRRVGEKIEDMYQKLKTYFGNLARDHEFQRMDFGGKLIYVIDQGLTVVSNWLSGPGGKKVQEVFVKLGEIAAKAWLKGLEGMVKGAGEAILHGNILGGIGLLAGAGMLGGGMVLRGAWGIGRWIAGKAGIGAASEVAATSSAASAAGSRGGGLIQALREWFVTPASKRALEPLKKARVPGTPEQVFYYRGFIPGEAPVEAFRIPGTAARTIGGGFAPLRYIGMFGKVGEFLSRWSLPITFATGAAEVALSRPESRVQTGLEVGGRIAGGLAGASLGAKFGAGIGTMVAPGIGTAIGGAIGGLGGGIAGAFGGETLSKKIMASWDSIKAKASSTWRDIATGASSMGARVSQSWTRLKTSAATWFEGIKTSITTKLQNAENAISQFFAQLPEKIGFAIGFMAGKIAQLPGFLASLPGRIGNFFMQIYTSASMWTKQTVDNVVNWFAGLPGRISSWLSQMVINISFWGQQVWASAVAWASQTVQGISAWWSSLPGRVSAWWAGVWSAVNTWAANTYSAVVNWFSSIPGMIEGWVSSAIDKISGLAAVAWEKVKNFRSRIESGYAAGYAAAQPHALGGIFNRPHLGLVAEAGPEAIIPLSARLRTRALDLWQRTGEYLGVKPYAVGGFAGPVPAVAGAGGGGGGNVNVTVAGITVHVAGNELDEDALALRIGRYIVGEIKKSLENRA